MSLQALSLDHETIPETAALLRELLASSTATPQHFESLTKQLLVVAEQLPPQSLARWDLDWFHQSWGAVGSPWGSVFHQVMVHPLDETPWVLANPEDRGATCLGHVDSWSSCWVFAIFSFVADEVSEELGCWPYEWFRLLFEGFDLAPGNINLWYCWRVDAFLYDPPWWWDAHRSWSFSNYTWWQASDGTFLGCLGALLGAFPSPWGPHF